MKIGWMLVLQAVLIFFNAVFACAEIAVLSLNELRLNKLVSEGNKKAKRLSKFYKDPAKFLATIQVAITLSGFLGSAFAAENFSDLLVDWVLSLGVSLSRGTLDTLAVILITLILSYVTLIFGELVPKRLAMKKSEQVALGISGTVSVISRLFAPIVWLLSKSTNAVLRLLGIDPLEQEQQVGEADIRLMVDTSSEQGGIDHEEKEFIQNIFEFDDLTADEIATHRTDVDMLWLEEDMSVWDETIHDTRHTLYPVCEDSPDNIIGILNAKDYFRLNDKSRESVLKNAVHTPYFVPATVKADVLFRNMRHKSRSLAVVLDEYGGLVGIVTLRDLVSQLVGDLEDEDDKLESDESIQKQEDGSLLIRGNVELADIEEAFEQQLPETEHETLTGLVFEALGYIPEDGQQNIDFSVCGLNIHLEQMEDHQVQRARVALLPLEKAVEKE